MRQLRATTPAKINLGLEVVGRRADGYHEVVTLMQAISLHDTFVWTETDQPFEYVGPPNVPREDDLAWRVLAAAPDLATWTGRLEVDKQIPMAAGLGGGSSDAALALRLAFPDSDDDDLSRRAAQIGSDVPFFIRNGAALATGTGTTLEPISTTTSWFVLLTPPVAIHEKTKALYSGLEPGDFSNGANVRDITTALATDRGMPDHLPNAFARQLLGHPVIRYAYDRLGEAGAELVSVSGAGPTLYAVTASHDLATRLAEALSAFEPQVGAIRVAQSLAGAFGVSEARAIAAALRGR